MTRAEVVALLRTTSPESYNQMQAHPTADAVIERLVLIATDQCAQLEHFGVEEGVRNRIVVSLIKRLSAYMSETGFCRLEASTQFLSKGAHS